MSSTRSSSPGATGPVVDRFDDEEDVIFLVDSPAASRKGIRTLVAMPAYNEEAAIAKTVLGARRHADAVLVVDDGSTDATVPIAEALGAIVVRHETNRGYGGALQTIFATARDLGAEELVIIDADGQHDPGEIPGLLAELRQGSDVVLLGLGETGGLDSFGGFGAYGKRAIEAIRISGEGAAMTSEAGMLSCTAAEPSAGRNSRADVRESKPEEETGAGGDTNPSP